MRLARAALLAAFIAVSGWYLAWLVLDAARLEVGLARTALHGALLGTWLGLLLALLEYALLDWELLIQPVHWWERALQGSLLGALVGAGSMVLAELGLNLAGNAPWARPLGWVLFGGALGAIEGVKWMSGRRALSAALGASVGGLLGGLMIELAPALLIRPRDAFVAIFTAAGAMGVFGALLGLGLAASQALTRRASLTVLDAPMPKQRGQSFPVGSIAEAETLGRLKATWTLTGDPEIQPRHAMLVKRGPAYAIHPLEGTTVEVSTSPFQPEDLTRVKEGAYSALTDPRQVVELRDGDVIRLGGGTYLYFEYKELETGRAPVAATAALGAALVTLALALGAGPALAAPVTAQLQDARGLEPPLVRADVLVLRGEDPVEGLAPSAFRVRVDRERASCPVEAVERASESSEPNFIVLVLDKSGSMVFKAPGGGGRNKLEVAKEAALGFVEQIRDQDQVAVIAFDGEAKAGDFTAAKEQLTGQIRAIEMTPGYAGLTNIYDGIGTALELLGRARADRGDAIRCSIVALTDGAQSVPAEKTRFKPADLTDLAKRHRVSIYTIGFGDRTQPRSSNGYVDEPFMRGLAQGARGTYQYALSSQDLARAYDRILRAIQGQYRLVFRMPSGQADPWTHPLTITVNLGGEQAQANGYFSFGGVIPKAPGSLAQRSIVTGALLALLGLAAWLIPLIGRWADGAMRPTRAPLGLVAEAMAAWQEQPRRGGAPAPIAQEEFPPPSPTLPPEPADEGEAPRRSVIKTIRKLD